MASFEGLPVDIILEIIDRCERAASIQNLISASPKSLGAFQAYRKSIIRSRYLPLAAIIPKSIEHMAPLYEFISRLRLFNKTKGIQEESQAGLADHDQKAEPNDSHCAPAPGTFPGTFFSSWPALPDINLGALAEYQLVTEDIEIAASMNLSQWNFKTPNRVPFKYLGFLVFDIYCALVFCAGRRPTAFLPLDGTKPFGVWHYLLATIYRCMTPAVKPALSCLQLHLYGWYCGKLAESADFKPRPREFEMQHASEIGRFESRTLGEVRNYVGYQISRGISALVTRARMTPSEGCQWDVLNFNHFVEVTQASISFQPEIGDQQDQRKRPAAVLAAQFWEVINTQTAN